MIVEYSSNNSGGSWWLKDEHWFALEKAGWVVEWKANDKDSLFGTDSNGRWLGALATSAKKEFNSIKDALREFEEITGADVSCEGCNCCGAPHSFNWKDGADHHYESGEGLLSYMYDHVPSSLREACK